MRAIMARDVNKEVQAGNSVWVFSEAGPGYLNRVRGYRSDDGWLACAECSFMVCGDSPCYVYRDDIERETHLEVLRAGLSVRRNAWEHGN